MTQSKTDPCVYYNKEKNTFIAIWVDDLMLFTTEANTKMVFKEKLKQQFEMKDIGPANKCIGLHITKDGSEKITGYCDEDWASDERDRKSCTGYILFCYRVVQYLGGHKNC